MTTVIIIVLGVLVLALLYCVGDRHQRLEALSKENKHLADINWMLLSQRTEPEVDLSNFTDREAATSLAVMSGYVSAVATYDVKEDPRRRATALHNAREYFRRHVADHVAAANH
jgi:hypothetical protein